MPPIFPGIGYTCFGVDRIRPGIRSGYRDAGSFALDDVLLAVPVEHDDVALLDESEPHRLGGLLKRRVKRNGVEAEIYHDNFCALGASLSYQLEDPVRVKSLDTLKVSYDTIKHRVRMSPTTR